MKALAGQAQIDRKLAQRDLYYLCKEILGYRDMVPHVHGGMCDFFTNPCYGRFRSAEVPRSWFKTWVLTIGGSIWLTLPDEESLFSNIYPFKGPNVRILIASYTIDLAAKMVNTIKRHWEENERLKAAFPEIVPDFNKTRWSDHCAEVARRIRATEGTYTAVGVGGSVVSQHFDWIQEDDLIYAKKDDFTGQELMPNQEDIDNAIGWHKLSFSLLVDPKNSAIFNVGTRWSPHDLIDYIRKHETQYNCFRISSTKDSLWPVDSDSDCHWPERYDVQTLEHIRSTQGAKIFETQYLGRPRAGEDVTFDTSYLHLYDRLDDMPHHGAKWYTFVDLAGWDDKKRRARNCILSGFKNQKHHCYVGRIDVGRFNPSEVIAIFKDHQRQFNSRVLVEAIQYQRSIRHFAKLDMEASGDFYDVDLIPHDGRKNAKDLRIQGLEPVVKNGAMHVLRSMSSLIEEMEDYPYGATKDALDCLAFLNKYATPAATLAYDPYVDPFTIGNIEKEIKQFSNQTNYPFSNQLREDHYAGF